MTRAVALLGHPVGHSLSPIFQNAAFNAIGLDIRYLAFDVPPALLGDSIRGLRALGFLGANVTVPHKIEVIQHLDDLSPEAKRIGAVNTITNRSGYLEGHNTDAGGFIKALEISASFCPKACRAVVIGTGGAGRAAAFALAEGGAAFLTLVNRTLATAVILREDLADLGYSHVHTRALDDANWEDLLGSHLIVNATTLGLAGDDQVIIPDDLPWPQSLVICDFVYSPTGTPLERLAKSRGLRVVPGDTILLCQGALSFSLWTGYPAPFETMKLALNKTISGGEIQ